MRQRPLPSAADYLEAAGHANDQDGVADPLLIVVSAAGVGTAKRVAQPHPDAARGAG